MKSGPIIEKIRNKLKDSHPDRRTVLSIFQFHITDAAGKLIKSVGKYIHIVIINAKCSISKSGACFLHLVKFQICEIEHFALIMTVFTFMCTYL